MGEVCIIPDDEQLCLGTAHYARKRLEQPRILSSLRLTLGTDAAKKMT